MKVDIELPNAPLGNNGILLKISSPSGKHTGDLRIGRATVTWRKSRARSGKETKIQLATLIDLLEQHGED
ncbi:hypothetical protein ACFYWU_36030 [Streptomyces chrestomyceticus]|uniref:hypothetical protein n=1 Tax=Streptomyces chrestomyceticus TaxID=68185 RepID=UPI0036848DFA